MSIRDPRANYIMMTAVVFLCAFEYIFAKPLLELVPTMTLIWMKYTVATITLVIVKLIFDRTLSFRAKDIPFFILLGLFGEVLYYVGGYNALNYIPVALVTVVIALCPVLSLFVERAMFGKKIRPPAVVGICISLFGIGMVAGVDSEMLASGRIWGYLLALLAVVSANIYNVIALKMAKRYSPFNISVYMIAATAVITMPFAFGNMPAPQAVDVSFVVTLIFLGAAVACFGLYAYVNSITVIGPTTSMLFSNFVPVVSCVFGWLILRETILPLQMVGGAITLTGCAAVIRYNGKYLSTDYLHR